MRAVNQQYDPVEAAEMLMKQVQSQLLEEGFIQEENGFWYLTDKGIERAQREMDRYTLRPGLKYMIGLLWAQQFGVHVE